MSTFSEILKTETMPQHQSAESAGFITTLMQGQRSARDFARLIEQYCHLYPVLEDAFRRVRENFPLFISILDPELERATHLNHDLAQLREICDLAEYSGPTSATTAYIQRVNELSSLDTPQASFRLLAHHYLRYLGDLSGGQIISRLVSRHYGVPASALTAWNFSHIPKLKVYKDQYRLKLNELVTDPKNQAALLDEARWGFLTNQQLFECLDEPELLVAS